MPKRIDLTGQRFGRLLALRPSHTDKRGKWHWLCRCDCGASHTVSMGCLRQGDSRSCGCLQRELSAKRLTTHGMSNSQEYKAWDMMRRRCSDRTNKSYRHYGGRGISVCSEWSDSFEAFYRDMGPRPSSHLTLDRIDNNGNYEPGNCRWATYIQQARNGRHNRLLTFNGQTLCMAAWAEQIGLKLSVLKSRLHRGWTTDRALTEPLKTAARKRRSSKGKGMYDAVV
jgi:hypothetical protein